MPADIDIFKAAYGKRVVEYLRSVSVEDLKPIVEAVRQTILTPRSTVYIFGNGGSHAIARHFGGSLKNRFANLCGLRANCGVDFHDCQSSASAAGYDEIFTSTLRAEAAGCQDLVILISGSGNSDNLLRAAAYCRSKTIRTISFAGFDGGSLTEQGLTEIPVVVKIHDQQVSEDVIQVMLHLVVEYVYRTHSGTTDGLDEYRNMYIDHLAMGLHRLRAGFLEQASHSISQAYLHNRGVFLLAPEGGGLSLSAEHTAHNLNWDAVFEVHDPPKRRIYSTPTNSDYSGIGNDRLMPGVVSCQQLERAEAGDLLVLYARDLACDPVRNTLAKATTIGMEVHAIAGHNSGVELPGIAYLVLGIAEPHILADLSQMAGHMLGRLTRMKLKQELRQQHDLGSDLARYLIEGDLAQRRLLSTAYGV